jgi:hypothetical protein
MSTLNQQPEGSLAITPAQTTQISHAEVTPMALLQIAMSQNADLDRMQRLMEMQFQWEAKQAEKAYVQAMSDFKKEAIVITKDKENKQYGSRYTSIGNLVNTVTPLLGKHGLSAEWALDQSNGIKVGCTITHALGHKGETKWMTVPEDKSGAKNPLQQIKSSITYAKITVFELATGLASTEGNLDDDGNGSGKQKQMEQSDYDRAMELIEAADSIPLLQRTFTEAYKVAEKVGDRSAMEAFIKAKDKRKGDLNASR